MSVKGYIVTVEVFVGDEDAKYCRDEWNAANKKQGAIALVEHMLESDGHGFQIKDVRRVEK